jgi:acyl carrier protein
LLTLNIVLTSSPPLLGNLDYGAFIIMEYKAIYDIFEKIFNNLNRSGVISAKIECTPDTVLMGEGTQLDSLAFVAFLADVEEYFSKILGKTVVVDLNNLKDFSIETPFVSIEALASYLSTLSTH